MTVEYAAQKHSKMTSAKAPAQTALSVVSDRVPLGQATAVHSEIIYN